MKRILAVFVALFCLGGSPLWADNHHREKLSRYTNKEYGVSFLYPTRWTKAKNNGERYEGDGGHFLVGAISNRTNSLESVIRSEVNHKLKPYGAKPRIMRRFISGQRVAVIVPYDESIDDAVIIIRSPRLVKGKYNFVVVYCDRNHIYGIAKSFELIK